MSFGWALAARSQQRDMLTAADYTHAESRLSYGTEPFVDNNMGRPTWLPGDRFWYRVLTAQGRPDDALASFRRALAIDAVLAGCIAYR